VERGAGKVPKRDETRTHLTTDGNPPTWTPSLGEEGSQRITRRQHSKKKEVREQGLILRTERSSQSAGPDLPILSRELRARDTKKHWEEEEMIL